MRTIMASGMAAVVLSAAVASVAKGSTLYVTEGNGDVATFAGAGDGAATYDGGSPNISFITGISTPQGVWVDSSGDVYVVSQGSVNSILEYSSTGGSTPAASSATYGTADTGLTAYNGYVYATSQGSSGTQGNRVFSFPASLSGSATDEADNTSGATGVGSNLSNPLGLAVGNYSSTPYLYAVAKGSGYVFALPIGANGSLTTNSSASPAEYSLSVGHGNIGGIAVDSSGNVWVVQYGDNSPTIYELTSSGSDPINGVSAIHYAMPANYNDVMGMTFGPDGNLYLAVTAGSNEGVAELNLTTSPGTFSTYLTSTQLGSTAPEFLSFAATPEPSMLTLLGIAPAIALLKRRRAQHT